LIYNKIRIIGGAWRSRKIEVLDKPGLRPTTDRVREMLFNWLMHDIVNANCLDLFAGSGALGFEALSRGAAHVDFVEQDTQAYKILKKNSAHLGAVNCNIVIKNSTQFIKQSLKKYDVIFIDPPFATNLLKKTMQFLCESDISEDCLVYAESDYNIADKFNFTRIIKQKKTGAVYSMLFKINKQDAS
jgi:16S rRNA (guanine966-N2)-methyltransferase